MATKGFVLKNSLANGMGILLRIGTMELTVPHGPDYKSRYWIGRHCSRLVSGITYDQLSKEWNMANFEKSTIQIDEWTRGIPARFTEGETRPRGERDHDNGGCFDNSQKKPKRFKVAPIPGLKTTDWSHPILMTWQSEASQAKDTRYRLLGDSRVGEFESNLNPKPHEVYDEEHHCPFDAQADFEARLLEYDNRRSVYLQWHQHVANGGNARDYKGDYLTTDVLAYDPQEVMPKRTNPVTYHTELRCDDYSPDFIGPTRQTLHKVGKRCNGYRDKGLRHKRQFVRQVICKRPPKCPQTETHKQVAYWGDTTGYYTRDDGISVGVHPLRHVQSELATLVAGLPTGDNRGSATCHRSHVLQLFRQCEETGTGYLIPYLANLVGSFKKLLIEFGANGITFKQNGKKFRFGYSYFPDFAFACLSQFNVVESNNRDSRYAPVKDAWRYAVNFEKQSLRHQLRQRFNENAEATRVVEDDEQTVKAAGHVKLDTLTGPQRKILDAFLEHRGNLKAAKAIGMTEGAVRLTMKRVRSKLAKAR